MRHVLRETEVTIDSIFAAIVAYVFAALAFAAHIPRVYVVAPASFHFQRLSRRRKTGRSNCKPSTSASSRSPPWDTATSPAPAVFANAGRLRSDVWPVYVAVVLAWLVSMYAAKRPRA
jgi:hypothetical protein